MKDTPVCDMVLLVFNNLFYTRECIESILRNTALPSRLIIVDNRSEENVREYLKGIGSTDSVEVTVILNDKNEGFAKGMNRGIRESKAEFVCLLNNDILVMPNWLNNMVEIASNNPSIGVVNPQSNNFGKVPDRGKSLDDFATGLSNEFKGRYIEVGQCIGFCMLIKRALIDKIGLLDEEQGFMFFEDTDYCYRAKRENFKCVIALGSYVYHHQHKSFGKIKEINKIFKQSQNLFYKRWGKPQRIVIMLNYRLNEDISPLVNLKEKIVRLLKDNHFVYIICRDKPDEKSLEKFGILHTNLSFINFKKIFFLRGILKILLKRKKPFDFIYLTESFMNKVLNKFKPFLKAELLDILNNDTMDAIWKRRFQSQS